MLQTIAISRIHFPVTALGPGRRIGIWFQGCSIRCPGCISADTWAKAASEIAFDDVYEVIEQYRDQAHGITITGGEPFDQPEALGQLLRGLAARLSSDIDVLVYSGYSFSLLGKYLRDWPGLIDALISEPYQSEATQTRALMGSDNQRLHLLTTLGEERFRQFDRPRYASDDLLDLMVDVDGTAWLAGIPKRGDLEKLRASLGTEGTRIDTTEQRLSRR